MEKEKIKWVIHFLEKIMAIVILFQSIWLIMGIAWGSLPLSGNSWWSFVPWSVWILLGLQLFLGIYMLSIDDSSRDEQ